MYVLTKPWRIRQKPEALQHTSLTWNEQYVLLSSTEPMLAANTSICGGGIRLCRHLINRHVDSSYDAADPEKEMEGYIRSIGLPVESTAGMMTAVDLRDAVGIRAKHRDFELFVLATAGVRNAARAGADYDPLFPAYHPGTVNLMIVFDAFVTEAALLNAMITATEAKAAALQDKEVVDTFGRIATGTTTDAILAASLQNAAYGVKHSCMGVSTEIGNALGKAVYETVRLGVSYYRMHSCRSKLPSRDFTK
jgi:adenosylcobinamide hydrolase